MVRTLLSIDTKEISIMYDVCSQLIIAVSQPNYSVFILEVICCCLLIGPGYAVNFFEENAIVVSSGSVSGRSPALVIDGISSSCSSLTGASKTWLRVDIQIVRYIREVRILFVEGTGAGAIIRVGRSLRSNGALDNDLCGTVSTTVTPPRWRNITCNWPVLGQFIYIESPINSTKICEIQVFYGDVILSYIC